ncbi:acyl-CoA thioesterase [Paenibacillus sp. JMULE4]|uniref:acyl-CoA thioesterase n=1 Tax=Paenibacillus TaxID=44249 RepID=UPI0007826570|nr:MULTISPECIES: thioesterase family protein [Paenibacillus]NTZ16167.1 acyl-CoA thioesterase [Paenibacillus sp. JMULE4]GCL74345.1 acyl-CoA thioesterase [Paenibacillus naphthalenovorans]
MKRGVGLEYRLVVDFDDVDYARVVYFARYLAFAEKAQAQVLRKYNLSHKRMAEQYNVATPVIRSEFSYLSPARLDDELIIHARIEHLSAKGFECEYKIIRAEQEKLICTGKTHHRFIDLESFKATEISGDLYRIFDTIRKEVRV